MGCKLSSATNAIRPREVYDAASDDSGILSLDVESLDQIARGDKNTVKEQFVLNKKPKTSHIEPPKKALARKLSVESYTSALSLDSGMGSPTTDTSQLFRNALKQRGYSVDTSKAKTNTHVVSICAQKLNIDEYPEGRNDGKPCSIYWHSLVFNDMKNFVRGPEARVNKFPGMTELSRKVALTRAIRSMRELFPSEYNFYPRSFILPSQYDEFQAFSRANRNKWFIIKPDDGCQGTGIYLANNPEQLHSHSEKMLIQEYVDDPYLLPDNLKFDFRVYAVIRSINPLSIYIAREGMARFCTEKYLKPTAGNMTQLFSHLTNYSLNKSNSNYVHSKTLKDQLAGSKRLLSTVFHQMEANGVKTRRLWHDIKMIIVKTILAMVPEIMICYEHYFCDVPGPQCFQIMGFDIIVRKDGFPYLLEVNSSPSLTIDHSTEFEGLPVRSIVDEMIKLPLVRDCMLLVLNQLDDQLPPNTFDGDLNHSFSNTEDDLALLRKKQKAHLSEIFPARYGHNSKHLLILDRAVYLFMQFVNIKLTLNITLLGARAFIKKCNLTDVVSADDLERHFASISYYFHGQNDSIGAGLPFHGFLQLLFRIANIKFGFVDDQLAALQRLFAYCDASLRHYGIRSTRLRRTEIAENDENEKLAIYLLPNRMRKSGKQSSTRRRTKPSYNSAGSLKNRSRSMVGQRSNNQNNALHTTRLPPVTIVH